jgi:hypothetical protein
MVVVQVTAYFVIFHFNRWAVFMNQYGSLLGTFSCIPMRRVRGPFTAKIHIVAI